MRFCKLLIAWTIRISGLHGAVRHLLWRLDSIINIGINATFPAYEGRTSVIDTEACEKLCKVTAIFFPWAFTKALFASPTPQHREMNLSALLRSQVGRWVSNTQGWLCLPCWLISLCPNSVFGQPCNGLMASRPEAVAWAFALQYPQVPGTASEGEVKGEWSWLRGLMCVWVDARPAMQWMVPSPDRHRPPVKGTSQRMDTWCLHITWSQIIQIVACIEGTAKITLCLDCAFWFPVAFSFAAASSSCFPQMSQNWYLECSWCWMSMCSP